MARFLLEFSLKSCLTILHLTSYNGLARRFICLIHTSDTSNSSLLQPSTASSPQSIACHPPSDQLHSFQFDRYASEDAKPTPPLTLKRQQRCGEVDPMTLAAPATAIGSTLVTVNRH